MTRRCQFSESDKKPQLYDLTLELSDTETAGLAPVNEDKRAVDKTLSSVDEHEEDSHPVEQQRNVDSTVASDQSIPDGTHQRSAHGLAAAFYNSTELKEVDLPTRKSQENGAGTTIQQQAGKRVLSARQVKLTDLSGDKAVNSANSQLGNLLMQKPRNATASLDGRVPAVTGRRGEHSSSASDDGYQSGIDTSILPLLLRKKLEGSRRVNAKPEILNKVTTRSNSQKPLPAFPLTPRPADLSSKKGMEAVSKVRSRGSYFPPVRSLKGAPKKRETFARITTVPSRKPSVYAPAMASPLRASTSRPVSPGGSSTMPVQGEEQGASVFGPSGIVFSDPFAQMPSGTDAQSIRSEYMPFYTPLASPLETPVVENVRQAEVPPRPQATVADTIHPIGSPMPTTLDETGMDSQNEDLTVASESTDSEDYISDNGSAKSTEILTAKGTRKARLSDRSPDHLIDREQEALTEAEKDLSAKATEVLIPGPRRILASKDLRDGYITYADFPKTYPGAVPRVEVTPGAIQNTQGEVIPIADEDIHLAAGETLIDGTGRVWNAKGMIEPGRDERGEAMLYEVDIAQIRQANNGELPAMMPWDDAQLFPDGWRSDGAGTPSYHPSEDPESETPLSDMSLHSEPGTPYGVGRRESEGDYLYQMDREMDASSPDDALDDIEMDEAAEEREAAEAAEEQAARLRLGGEERKAG